MGKGSGRRGRRLGVECPPAHAVQGCRALEQPAGVAPFPDGLCSAPQHGSGSHPYLAAAACRCQIACPKRLLLYPMWAALQQRTILPSIMHASCIWPWAAFWLVSLRGKVCWTLVRSFSRQTDVCCKHDMNSSCCYLQQVRTLPPKTALHCHPIPQKPAHTAIKSSQQTL